MPGLVERRLSDVALLILDQVVAAVPMSRNSHNNAESRNGMQPVVDFAKTADIAVLEIGHLTKGTVGKDPLSDSTAAALSARCRVSSWAPRRLKRKATASRSKSLV
jgi:putative DNA primase/helicase